MDIDQIIKSFRLNNGFGQDEIEAVRSNQELRTALVAHFKTERDRPFALALLNTFIELRKDPENEIPIEDLMLAGFLLGAHGHVEDSLKIWEAKQVDFDTYCGLDIQLVAFAGVDKTISFLQTQTSDEAGEALKYILICLEAGDFNNLKGYYDETHWWI